MSGEPEHGGSAGTGAREPRVVVLACGEMARGDDAAALIAAARLTELGDGRIDVRVVGGLEPEHLADLRGRPCIVADCVVGVEPGEIVVRLLGELLPGARGPADGPASEDGPVPADGRAAAPVARSTHLLPLGDVLALVELLDGGLPPGRFVGVGGVDFGLGRPLSTEVERALPTFVAAILAAAEELLAAED